MKKLNKSRLYNIIIMVCIIVIMVGSFGAGWISRGMTTTTNAVPHKRKVVVGTLKTKTLHWNDAKGWCWI